MQGVQQCHLQDVAVQSLPIESGPVEDRSRIPEVLAGIHDIDGDVVPTGITHDCTIAQGDTVGH